VSAHRAADRLIGEHAVAVIANIRNVVDCSEQRAGI
jgi:hypothetical protein